jgi:hypothetical protein
VALERALLCRKVETNIRKKLHYSEQALGSPGTEGASLRCQAGFPLDSQQQVVLHGLVYRIFININMVDKESQNNEGKSEDNTIKHTKQTNCLSIDVCKLYVIAILHSRSPPLKTRVPTAQLTILTANKLFVLHQSK